MTQIDLGLPVNRDAAKKRIEESLAQGSPVALAAVRLLDRPASAFALVPDPSVTGLEEFDAGKGIKATGADALAAQLFRLLRDQGARTIVVEDDLARRGDRHLPGPAAFLGDRVLRWASLERDPASAAALLRRGSSGYPLNAFVINRSESSLGLVDQTELHEAFVNALVQSTLALITSIYDAESYLVWVLD